MVSCDCPDHVVPIQEILRKEQVIMATTIQRAKGTKKEMKMSDTMVSPAGAGVYGGKVKKNVKDPFGTDPIERVGKFSLPLATSLPEALEMVKNSAEDVVFWFNHGRKLQARVYATSKLDFDLGSKEMNDLFDQYNQALESMQSKDDTKERQEQIKQFVLSIPKFKELSAKLDEVRAGGGLREVDINFAETELIKPSGIRGRRKATTATGETVEVETEDEE